MADEKEDKSMKYISFTLKDLVAELKKLNEQLEKITKRFEQKDPFS